MYNYGVTGYRIVEIKDGKVMSLFHSTNGSRQIPLDIWHTASKKIVKDGTNGKLYDSGWHFLPTEKEAIDFLNRMFRVKENRFVVKCYLRGNIRPKQHSTRGGCWLADEIYISKDVIERIKLNDN